MRDASNEERQAMEPTTATIPGAAPTKAAPDAPQRPYRVLMIAPTSFFADYGCHVRIYEEVRILQQLGHQVTVVTYRTGAGQSSHLAHPLAASL